MTSTSFENLMKVNLIKPEPVNQNEITALLIAGKARLKDASHEFLSKESRFDLAYNAAHSFALAALRIQGYRSNNRYVVFQTLPLTLSVGPEIWRVLSKCHEKRNLAEYEGHWEIDVRLFDDLMQAAQILQTSLSKFIPKKKKKKSLP